MDDVSICWNCNQELEADMIPVVHLSQCRSCQADLHTCMACAYYDPKHRDKCTADKAEIMHELEQANFCHYFSLQVNPFLGSQSEASKEAKSRLEALFGWEKKGGRGDL